MFVRLGGRVGRLVSAVPNIERPDPVCRLRKVKGKTVSVALSKQQYEWLAAAIANWRTVQATLKAMQQLSRGVLFTTLPDTQRRKRLSKKVLGIT